MPEPVPPDAGEFFHDVFISYSSGDQAWVRGELLPRIEQAGLRAFIDYRDFTRGTPSIKEMQRGVVKCRKTLLILTPAYVASEWCELEGLMVQTLTPANRQLRILPLLKSQCDKPLYVGALTHIDFTHIDFTPTADHTLAQGWALAALGNSYALSGQPRRAVPLFEQQIAIREKQGEKRKRNLAVGLGNMAMQQLLIGSLLVAEVNVRRCIALGREIKEELHEAVGHHQLGWLLACRGEDAESETELATALEMFETAENVQGQCVVWAYRALRELLRLRSAQAADGRSETDCRKPPEGQGRQAAAIGNRQSAITFACRALERCRRINLVDQEANILIDLARLRAASTPSTSSGQSGSGPSAALDEALRHAEEAREIAERSGYALQAADAHLELAKLALAPSTSSGPSAATDLARHHATCDGPPPPTPTPPHTPKPPSSSPASRRACSSQRLCDRVNTPSEMRNHKVSVRGNAIRFPCPTCHHFEISPFDFASWPFSFPRHQFPPCVSSSSSSPSPFRCTPPSSRISSSSSRTILGSTI